MNCNYKNKNDHILYFEFSTGIRSLFQVKNPLSSASQVGNCKFVKVGRTRTPIMIVFVVVVLHFMTFVTSLSLV